MLAESIRGKFSLIKEVRKSEEEEKEKTLQNFLRRGNSIGKVIWL